MRRSLALLSVMALAVTGALTVVPASASAAPPFGGYFRLQVRKGGKCLDANNHGVGAAGAVVVYPCGTTAAGYSQQWEIVGTDGSTYVRLKNRGTGKCLAVLPADQTVGRGVTQNACVAGEGGYYQQVTLAGIAGPWAEHIFRHSGLCLNAPRDVANTQATQSLCRNDNTAEQFQWIAVPD